MSFKDVFKTDFFKFQEKITFIRLFTYFLSSFINVVYLYLVTKLPSFNYYHSENQNGGVKDLYTTMVLKNHFQFILTGFLRRNFLKLEIRVFEIKR